MMTWAISRNFTVFERSGLSMRSESNGSGCALRTIVPFCRASLWLSISLRIETRGGPKLKRRIQRRHITLIEGLFVFMRENLRCHIYDAKEHSRHEWLGGSLRQDLAHFEWWGSFQSRR